MSLPLSAHGSLPLDGILVVGIEQAVAAPFCTRELSDLGARVIKVEPAEGDFARHYDDVVHGTSAYFAWANRGKESIVLDLKSDAGRVAHRADLDAVIGAWLGQHDFDDIAERASAAGLGWARFNKPTEVIKHPQLTERNRWRDNEYLGQSFPEIAPAAITVAWEQSAEPVPGVGEHTAAIAAEFGLTAAGESSTR